MTGFVQALIGTFGQATREIGGTRACDVTEELSHPDALRAFDAAIRAAAGEVVASTPPGGDDADGGGRGS